LLTADPKLSTMRKLTEALGGTLRIQVCAGDRSIELGTDASDGGRLTGRSGCGWQPTPTAWTGTAGRNC